MIKINLAKKKRAGFLTSDSKGLLSKLNIDKDELKEFPLLKMGLSIAVVAIAMYVAAEEKEKLIKKEEQKLVEINAETQKLKTESIKYAGFESVKKQMEEDEFTLRSKIEAIESLVKNRTDTVQLFMAFSQLMPTEVWLESMQIGDGNLNLQGKSIGISTVSDFLKKMRENVYFSDVVLDETEQVDDGSGVELAKFSMSTRKEKKSGH